MAQTVGEQVAIEEVRPGEYISKLPPDRLGNKQPIAYGGCALGIATRAAYATVPSNYSLYSLVGQFLGPASTTEKLLCTVHRTRDTKTFATRRIEVRQRQSDGTIRKCLELLADFHVEEPALLTYSASPSLPYSGPDSGHTIEHLAETVVSKGLLDAEPATAANDSYRMLQAFFDVRCCPEGMTTQNMLGAMKKQPTNQDSLPFTDRASAEWIKAKMPLTSAGEKAAALSFYMDGGLAFLPLIHGHLYFDDAGACSTLDFALRVFVPSLDLSNWHLRERKTIAGGGGRTYTVGRLWNEKGVLVASMTQQGILRPRSSSKVKATL